jgi:saccharopine dehydrogenase-like NADP-dependent oxidoreductase
MQSTDQKKQAKSLHKVVVLGTGKIGKLVINLLANSGKYEVLAVDKSLEISSKAIQSSNHEVLSSCSAASADFSDKNSLETVLAGQHYVVSCAPYYFNTLIAEVAKKNGVNYLDLTEDVATTKSIKKLSEGSKQAFIPQCGLAPGFITIVAAGLAKEFTQVESVKMRVGALPKYPHNALKYNLTWSTEGLINEYGNPCECIDNGKLILVPPLEGLETLSLDGTEYEAFNTSGGLGTLAETWAGKVQHLDYKSIRYPGHRSIVSLLMNDLKLNHDRETLKRIFETALPYTQQDVVLIFVTVTGTKEGKYFQKTYAKKIYDAEINGQHWGAIQITTAAGICAVLSLHAEGKISQSGFLKQEDIDFNLFLQNEFGRLYQ